MEEALFITTPMAAERNRNITQTIKAVSKKLFGLSSKG
jgi:hypothetical protein